MTFVLKRCDETHSQQSSITGSPMPESGFGAIQSKAGNLPLKQLGYHARMFGLAVRTTILQTYYNPFDEAIEATYIFPIEGQQAVVACEFHVAGRVVRAKLKERAAARADYDRALRAGYRAAILEENRPETFSMRVGNIPPGEAIQVCIETVGQLDVVHGEWTLRLPLVVAPRYTSGFALPFPPVGDGVGTDTYEVPDASTVTPPTWLPGFASPVDLRLTVDIDLAHFAYADRAYSDWVANLESSLHSVLVEKQASDQRSSDNNLDDNNKPESERATKSTCRIQVMPGERVNRDFILRGRVHADTPVCSLAIEQAVTGDSQAQQVPAVAVVPVTTLALTVVPPKVTERASRDVAFVLDRSGSMSGWKMGAARRGIARLIDSLQARDRFQLLAFDDSVDHYTGNNGKHHAAWQNGNDSERFEAVRWLGNVEPRGGTEMGSALKFAFQLFKSLEQPTQAGPANPRSRALVLVTDGQITGEDSLMRLLGSIPEQNRPRLYCLGIDRCVNASVMQRLSKFTGGTFELVESEKRLDEVLQRFASEIGSPAISNLTVTVDAACRLQLAPGNANTLYSDRSLTIYASIADVRAQSVSLNLSGQLASGDDWHQTIAAELSPVTEKPLLLPLWGKNRVRELEDQFIAGGSSEAALQEEILACSLQCNVLSRLTAFVAVDESETVTSGDRPHKIVQPSEFPEGWQTNLPRLHQDALLSIRPRATSWSAGAGSHFKPVDSKASNAPDVKLEDLDISEDIIELIPESVARENKVIPVAKGNGELTVAMQDPNDIETIEKLRFILNRRIIVLVADGESIEQAINQYYGQIAGESADSMLQEFTDTAIDFTETASDLDLIDGFSQSIMPAMTPMPGPGPVRDGEWVAYGDFAAPTPEISHLFSRMASGLRFNGPRLRQAKDSPSPAIIRLVQLLIAEAVKLKASHIFASMQEGTMTIQYLIDGKVFTRDSIPGRLCQQVCDRIAELSNIRLKQSREPQTGRLRLNVGSINCDATVMLRQDMFLIELKACETPEPELLENWRKAMS